VQVEIGDVAATLAPARGARCRAARRRQRLLAFTATHNTGYGDDGGLAAFARR
jgi:hypothetical protein